MRWIPFVMVRITGFLTGGIITAIYFPALFTAEAATVFLIAFCFVYYPLWWLVSTRRSALMITGVVGLTIVFLTGYKSVQVRDESNSTGSLLHVQQPVLGYRVIILSTAERKENSWKCTGSIQAIQTSEGWKACSGKLNLYWPHAERVDTLEYGDGVLIKGAPQRVQGPQNPHEFDYQRFLAFRNIFHQHYIRSGQWIIAEETTDHGFMYLASRARTWTSNTIDHFVEGPREQAIVKAFVIGVTEGVDDELRQAYSSSGAMHALAVSGLHVSILYGVLVFLLSRLDKHRAGQWFVAGISLLVLWMFAFVTGLSPSVLRAVAMFSFVAIAKPINRTTSIYNTLAASAFFLLLYDPFLILSAGFQLSYLAVLGIVVFYRPIYNLWETPWVFSNWLWRITAVSIAAQLATMPLTLYYFHQFPIYFLLANLFVIPASMVILLGGILLLLVSPAGWIAGWLGKGLHLLVYLLNEGLFWIEQLPLSVINGISFTLIQAFCIGAFILGLFLLIRTRKFYWVTIIFAIAIIFSAEDWRANSILDKRQFTVYRVNGHSAMEWSASGQARFLADSLLQSDLSKINYHIQPNRLSNKIDRVQELTAPTGISFFRVSGKTFLWIRSTPKSPFPALHIDYLIVGANALKSLESLNHNNHSLFFDYLIFDSSNSLRYCERLEAEARKLGIPCYSVLSQGSLTVNL